MAGAFRRASHYSTNKKVSKIEIVLNTQTPQSGLKFIIVIVLSETEIVQSMHIVQNAARIIGEPVSK